MIKNKTALAVSTALFLTVETLLGIRFQVNADYGAPLRYTTVILACLFCILFARRSCEYLLTQLALIMTVCADCFLVLPSQPLQLPGMLFFVPVQLAYAARLYLVEKAPNLRKWQIIARVLLSGVALIATVLVLGKSTDAVALLSLLYYTNLILNVVFACGQFRKQRVLALGLILFLCCDTVVGLSFLDGYFTVTQPSLLDRIIHPGFDLVWAFYLPSQMLLAVSLLPAQWRVLAATNKPNTRQSERSLS